MRQRQQRRSLNAYVGWHQVLPLLGVKATTGSMPLMVQCPLCHGHRLHIYDDTKFGGNWHYCPDCRSAGDMIELAAATWDCDLPQAIHKLTGHGAPFSGTTLTLDAIEAYAYECPGMQERCRLLAIAGRKRLGSGLQVAGLLHQLGLPKDQHRQYWKSRMGRFMGGVPRLRALRTFAPTVTEKQSYATTPHGTLFPGKAWHDVLSVPFHDLPGRCAGVLFLGRKGKPDKDYAFKVVDTNTRAAADPSTEIGCCMYDVMDAPTAHTEWFQNTIFVMNDPLQALKMQARFMRDSELPLPIVGTYPARVRRRAHEWRLVSHDIWGARPDKKFIFWGAKLSPDLFDMAARADGLIYISRHLLDLQQQPMQLWLRHIQKRARHWTEVLETQLRVLPEAAAVTLLQQMNMPPGRMQYFKATCAPQVRELLDRHRHDVRLLSSVIVRGKRITESEAGWFLQKTSECISDAVIRVEKVICRDDDENAEAYYHGRILYQEEQIEFTEPMSKVDKNPGEWLKKKLLAKAKKLVTVRRGWTVHLMDVARAFYTPTVINEDGRFGWKPRDSQFLLPQFAVHLGGSVSEAAAHTVDEWTPGRNLTPPSIPPADIAMITRDTPSNRIFWAAMGCLGANIIAPATGQPVRGIGVVGHGALMVGHAAATAAGCCELSGMSTGGRYGVRLANQLTQITTRHRWPLYLTLTRGCSRTILGNWLNGDFLRNVMTYLDKYQADLAGMLDPWRFVRCTDPVEPGPEVQLYGRHVIPMWLERVAKRKLLLESDAGSEGHRVLDDMAHMMAPYGDSDFIQSAHTLIDDETDDPSSQAVRFVSLVCRFVMDGVLRTEQAGYDADAGTAAIVKVDDGTRAPGVFIGREMLARATTQRYLPLPDPGRITDALRAANALDCECQYNGETGWFIIESWWSRQVDLCQAHQQQRLRVIGGSR